MLAWDIFVQLQGWFSSMHTHHAFVLLEKNLSSDFWLLEKPRLLHSFMKVASTYGMNGTSTEFALMDYSGGVFRPRKQPGSLKDATHHRMDDIMGLFALMLRSGKVDFSSQSCMKT